MVRCGGYIYIRIVQRSARRITSLFTKFFAAVEPNPLRNCNFFSLCCSLYFWLFDQSGAGGREFLCNTKSSRCAAATTTTTTTHSLLFAYKTSDSLPSLFPYFTY